MRIGVIGSGALGLYYGALLQRAGHELHFLLRRDFEAIETGGLQVTSPRGNFHLTSVNGYRDSSEIGPVDLVLIGLKTYANSALPELVRPLVGPETIVLTLQNGLGNEEVLNRTVAADNLVGGVAFLCCNRGTPGTVHHLDQGAIRLAEFHGGLSQRLNMLAALFDSAGVPCEACPDLAKIRWEKLVWNIPFNGLCALTGLPTSQLLACAESRALVTRLMQEVITVANRQGLSERIDEEPFIQRMLKATEGMGDYRPSMMIDRLEHRPLELDAIYGIPIARAEQSGVAVPQVSMLAALLTATES